VFVTWDESSGRREFPVEGADAKTFEILDLHKRMPFARDKNHVYQRTVCISGADPSSFRKFGTSSYRDDESVFLCVPSGLEQLPDSDPDSFEWLKEPDWSRDKSQVFWRNFGFIPRNMDSFELLEGDWAKDDLMFYHQNLEIPGVDRDTFVIDKKYWLFARDRAHVYWQGRIIRYCDPKLFVATSNFDGHDLKTKYSLRLEHKNNPDTGKRSDTQTLAVHRGAYVE
jgi:hypothetical protein